MDAAFGVVSSLICSPQQICFIPSFFIDPGRYPSLRFMDGYFNVCYSFLEFLQTLILKVLLYLVEWWLANLSE